MIINRVNDWFEITDLNSDYFYLSIRILDKLSTRSKIGFEYDSLKLSSVIAEKSNVDTIRSVDVAISLLIARNLIRIEHENGFKRYIFITPEGVEALRKYKEELSGVHKKT